MAIWERYQPAFNTVTNVGDHESIPVLHNEIGGSDNFQVADLVVVDGIITVMCDTNDLCGVRMLILDENIATADINEDDPEPHHPSVYYSWFCAAGPLVFRLRSKKTLPPEHKLWFQIWKANGVLLTSVKVGVHLYIQLKH